ncbi:hypothetical protein Tco_0615085 [Tanacetum coccineum]
MSAVCATAKKLSTFSKLATMVPPGDHHGLQISPAKKGLDAGFFWPSIYKDANEFEYSSCVIISDRRNNICNYGPSSSQGSLLKLWSPSSSFQPRITRQVWEVEVSMWFIKEFLNDSGAENLPLGRNQIG